MIESGPKSELVALMRRTLERPLWEVLRLEELSNGGVPDISLTGLGWSSWWEVKFAKPKRATDLGFRSKANQHLSLRRLAAAGYARYVVYDLTGGVKQQVRIVHPRNLHQWRTAGVGTHGFDHAWVVEFMRNVHERLKA